VKRDATIDTIKQGAALSPHRTLAFEPPLP
jgi:hypothetical protein